MNIQTAASNRFSVVLFLAMIFLSSPIVFAAPGDVDLSFTPPTFTAPTFTSLSVNASVVQPDGKIVVGGSFTNVNGIAQISLARLNADGSRDASFASPFVFGGTDTTVQALALQADGKILVGGILITPGGTKNLIRVNADGTLDTSFVVAASSVFGQVLQIVVEANGQILASGNFSGVSRLNPNGSFVGAVGTILQNASFVLQPDGKLVISGMASFGGDATFRFVGADIDPTFHGGTSSILAIRGQMALQPNGKIIVYGGSQYTVDGITRRGMIRLNSDGTVDPSLDAGNVGGGFVSIKLQTDGKIVAGGFFFLNGESSGYGFARFNSNGTLDTSFSVPPPTRNTNDIVRTVNIDSNGRILIGGYFTQIGNTPRSLFARILFNTSSKVSITINDVTLNEGNSGTTAFNFTVNLSFATTNTVAVNYATTNGTATAPADYQPTSGTLSFAPGEIAKTVTVQVNGDTDIEPTETFTVNLTGAVNAAIVDSIGLGTITTDDVCTYSIAPTSLNINANGGAGNIITVTTQTGCAYTAVSNNSFVTINSGANGSGSGTVAFTVAANAGAARTGTIAVAGQTFTVNQTASAAVRRTKFDFDGDGKADVSIYRPNTGTWYSLNSTTGYAATQWGFSTDKIVPADYDGDGKTDIAVYRPNSGTWYFLNTATGFSSTQWGISTDIPVPADYDGDGKADIAVYRPNTGMWYILSASGSYTATQFGFSTDKAVPADYDGDGKADIAIYRPNTGTWYFLNTTAGFSATQWGISTDKPVPADYDGDGKTDIAIYRQSNGTWYLLQTAAGFKAEQWGINTDSPIPADYDGDGKADITIYRPNTGTWYFLNSTTGFGATQWGINTDLPIPAVYLP